MRPSDQTGFKWLLMGAGAFAAFGYLLWPIGLLGLVIGGLVGALAASIYWATY